MLQLVADGHGVGVGLEVPATRHTGVRAIPLTGFEPVQVVAVWHKPAGPWHESLLAAIRATAQKIWPAAALMLAVFTGRWTAAAEEILDPLIALVCE